MKLCARSFRTGVVGALIGLLVWAPLPFGQVLAETSGLTIGARRQITQGPGGYHPRWSPDSQQIAHVGDSQIWVVEVGGITPTNTQTFGSLKASYRD